MAEDNMDNILVRLNEIEKLQAELRHLVPRDTNNSGHTMHQDLSHDSSTSTRFPSLFTFPVISPKFSSTSSKNQRVQRSAAQMNLSNRLSSSNRSSTTSVKNSGKLSRRGSATNEGKYKDLLKSMSNTARYGRNSLASTSSLANSKNSMMPHSHLASSIMANRSLKNSHESIKKEFKSDRSTTSKMPNAISWKSNIRLLKESNMNASERCAFSFSYDRSIRLTSSLSFHPHFRSIPQSP